MTTSFSIAIDAIATFPATITGIRNAYTLANTPAELTREKLPCAVILPSIESGEGYQTLAAMGGSPKFEFSVTQLILWTDAAKDYGKAGAALVTFWDNYMAAINTTPFYTGASNPAVHSAPLIKPDFGKVVYGDVEYLALTLKHTNLRINL